MSSSSRGPRSEILIAAAALAVAVLVIVALLGSKTASKTPSRTPSKITGKITSGNPSRAQITDPAVIPPGAARISVSDAPFSPPVPPGFVGLSLEYTAVEAYAGTDPNAINPALVDLVRNLAPGGASGVAHRGQQQRLGLVAGRAG